MFNHLQVESLNQPLFEPIKTAIQAHIDNKTKPLGALGLLEQVASQLALIQYAKKTGVLNSSDKEQLNTTAIDPILINQAQVFVFAGDHGIADEGVSIAPSAVTRQMVLNFLNGGAAINCFCKVHSLPLTVVDTGIIEPLNDDEKNEQFIEQRCGASTKNFAKQAAMSANQCEQALDYGYQLIQVKVKQGCDLILLGEMGIANTSSAAAILAALTKQAPEDCVGLGTGISEAQYQLKLDLIKNALPRAANDEPISILQEFGGFEIAQMVGAILSAAEQKVAVLIDGFIVTSAALLAVKIQSNCRDYLIFAHASQEKAHQMMLAELNASALLDLGLRLGEGTGAALAYPILQSACLFYNEMASFDSAGVSV